ncbi:MAG TPA: hypothetical protein VIJ94_06070 [Caulobacteraceae bacterium]
MQTQTNEIADDVYRFSTLVPDVAGPGGFMFNQFLMLAEEPMLFHCGGRGLFPLVSEAVAAVVSLERLRWWCQSNGNLSPPGRSEPKPNRC